MGDTNNNTALDTKELEKALILIRQIKKEFKDIDSESKSINSNINKYNQAIKHGFINMPKGADRVLASSMKDIAKISPDVAKMFMGTGAGKKLASTEVFKTVAGMSGALAKAVPVIALVTTALTAMTAAGAIASDTVMDITRSLRQFGGDLGDISNNATEAVNKMSIAKNRLADYGDTIAGWFEPIYEGFADIAYGLTEIINVSRDFGEATTELTSKLMGAAEEFNSAGLETPYKKSLASMASTASVAQQSGFDMTSSANLGIGTYNAAVKLAMKYGQPGEVDNIAKKLTDAWAKGNDAAKDYGIVVNDETLYGWLAQEKNIDAVNVKLSDAQMQAYRYELAMIQASQSGTEGLQDQIKAWKQYGTQLKAAQNQLLSFEQVVTLRAADYGIPGIPDTVIDLDKVEKAGEEIEKAVTPPPITPTIDTAPATMAVNELENRIEGLSGQVNVGVNFNVSGNKALAESYEMVNALAGLSGAPSTASSLSTSNVSTASSGNKFLDGVSRVSDWLLGLELTSKVQAINDWTKENQFYEKLGWGSFSLLAGLGTMGIGSGIVSSVAGSIDSLFGSLAIPSLGSSLLLGAHYDGGISTRAHLAKISEHNSTEAIIPLNNPSAIPAFDRMAETIADRLVGSGNGGNTANTYNLAPGGVVIADNYSVDRFVELIANKMATLNRDRGDMSYGIR